MADVCVLFNTVLAYRDPTQKIVYDNYMAVRKNLDFLKSWIADRLKDIQSGKTPEPEKTFAWYWLKNGEESEARIKQLGLAQCPFPLTSFDVKDGRRASLHNSGFGTVFGVVDDRPLPVCDYAGFAPFGFGYRRCPGEQLTIMAFDDLIRKVAEDGLQFVEVAGANPQKVPLGPSTPEMVPIGPTTVISDDIGFVRPA